MSEISRASRDDEASWSTRALSRIAVALGKPETAFLDRSNTLADLADTCELLRIWNGLEHAADSRKVLAFARSLAGQN